MFRDRFNSPLERVSFLTTLRRMTFGRCFSRSITGVVWPKRLQTLSFGDIFNQPMAKVFFPPELAELTVGICLNQGCLAESVGAFSYDLDVQPGHEGGNATEPTTSTYYLSWPTAEERVLVARACKVEEVTSRLEMFSFPSLLGWRLRGEILDWMKALVPTF